MASSPDTPHEIFAHWLEAMESRYLADLRVPEVTRALRSLSSAYVQRRVRGTLEGAGKRAAVVYLKR